MKKRFELSTRIENLKHENGSFKYAALSTTHKFFYNERGYMFPFYSMIDLVLIIGFNYDEPSES